jgi:CBS domain-containing protein
MRIEEIMSTPTVVTQPGVKISNLKDMFTRKNINAVPVLEEDGTISGIISSSDLIAVHNESLLVRDIMSRNVHIGLKNNRVKDAAKMMVKHDVHHLVIMDDGHVVGMLSSMDIIKVYAEE